MKKLGVMNSGEDVFEFVLKTRSGMSLSALSYGGIITHLFVPDREGILRDIVLGKPTWESYVQGHPWMGAITGRVAGRISDAVFSLNGQTYPLEANQAPHHLHGGSEALDKKVWRGELGSDADGSPQLSLSYTSPDGEAGYPGEAKLLTRYTLTEGGELIIDFEAEVDQVTPLALTQHLYFNLNGAGQGTVHDHILQLDCSHYIPMDERMGLTGQVTSVENTSNDFQQAKRVGDALPSLFHQHGEMYLTSSSKGELARVGSLYSPLTGISMEVESTTRCVQLYTGCGLSNELGKGDNYYEPFSGLCLECQGYPNALRHPWVDQILVKPTARYRERTVYRFTN